MAEIDTPEKRLNPFSIYNHLRQTTPIRYDASRDCWDVFGYEDVHRILKDPGAFSSIRGVVEKSTETILTMDPPRHTQMRALVNKAFTPRVIADLAPHIESITNELMDSLIDRNKMDVVHDLAVPLPIIVIAELLGVPSEDRKLFKVWSDTLVKGTDVNTEEALKQISTEKAQALQELTSYFKEIVGLRRTDPKEDLISLLLSADIEGEKLSLQEIIGFAILLLAAGNETTTNLITNAVRVLTEQTSIQQQLLENSEWIPGFIEEVLRFYPPIQAIGRVAASDIEIGDTHIKKGDQVVSWVASANRDETKFSNPDVFVADRRPNAHLSFGFGIHFCLGAPLARLEAQIAIRAIVNRLTDIRFATGSKLAYIQSTFVFGVKQFPIVFDRK
ncbi:cytochrome P450 [Paenibacillus sp. N3.4]|uniref:cytochrome P450 n=1 Tax=Paenibacillus sp. N3.4 TaxID=2603222 RepID=UPI0011CA0402|nr:cytochrome P450 [Paenibacillus sp. N3.4]TXK66620.1 cytochrome P450 [Paenibacillus sp. N3.4]